VALEGNDPSQAGKQTYIQERKDKVSYFFLSFPSLWSMVSAHY
jgi:hypothetical protein